MNIGIFETQHFEGAYPMIRIMDMPGNQLTIFVNEETHKRFADLFGEEMRRYQWIIQPLGVSDRRFILTLYRACKEKNIELLFLNTVSANFILYGWMAMLLQRTRVILTLHDANSFLHSRFSINIRRTVRHIGKKVLGRFCTGYSTVSETVQQYLQKNISAKKQLSCIPGAVFEKKYQHTISYQSGEIFQLVVPGSYDGRRREYEKVFQLLQLINKKSLPVRIVLAGGPYGEYGKSILTKCRQYTTEKSNLVFFEQAVLDQEIFDKALLQSHAIWIPSVIRTTISDRIEEIYGLTKSSGNIFDAIKYARPILVPEGLAIEPALKTSSFAYADLESLMIFLERMVTIAGKYNEWADHAKSNSGYYTVENIRERIKGLL